MNAPTKIRSPFGCRLPGRHDRRLGEAPVLLARISNRIINEVKGVNRVVSTFPANRRGQSSGSNPIFDCRFSICDLLFRGNRGISIVKRVMRRTNRAKSGNAADRKPPPSMSNRQLKQMRGFLRGINTADTRESDRV